MLVRAGHLLRDLRAAGGLAAGTLDTLIELVCDR